jgi:hypothetical protein
MIARTSAETYESPKGKGTEIKVRKAYPRKNTRSLIQNSIGNWRIAFRRAIRRR